MFQSTPARGGRRSVAATSIDAVIEFQSTPARGGRRSVGSLGASALGVSIHARARRATIAIPVRLAKVRRFQSTPARGGRRSSLDNAQHPVSIHARARRATCGRHIGAKLTFQSTPARGGRLWAS